MVGGRERGRRSGGRLWRWLTGRSTSYSEAFARGASFGALMSIPAGLLAASVVFVEPRPDESWVTGVRNAALVFAILTVAMGFLWCVAAGASVRCNKLVADFPYPSGRVGGFRCSIGGRADVLTLQPTDSHLLAELDSGGAFAVPWHLVRRPRVQQTTLGEAVLFGTPAGTIKVFPSNDATALVEQFEERMSPRS